ncbi:MAG: FAD-binding protein [Bacteroides sp.]|nr:FAD-binding protein [Bacteroides sp.]MCM1378718.1 FAD-binding protein [Bacteroides sp.]MCM1444991.1 FAD-binding protein [Prevotella sp.]
MREQLQIRVTPEVAYEPMRLQAYVSTALNVDANRITGITPCKRSIDARQRQVIINLDLLITIDEPAIDAKEFIVAPDYKALADDAPQAIVVGAGPAGLFAALRLIEGGVKPILLERGKDVDSRRVDMAAISREGKVDPESNYCFGEGGAGAYSDGKLYTRSKKRGSVDKVLSIFVKHGADPNILIDAHPHIGSDKLPGVIREMRKTILTCGGEVRFQTKVTELRINDGKVVGVKTADGETILGPVILATGHSARDVYQSLNDSNIELQPKGIAVGVRLEHPQNLIDQLQYHSPKGRGKYLPAAEYSMLTRVDGRGVYSFCMCPGGYIIPATNEPGLLVVNGMSPASRGTAWANSGMVVEVLPEDVEGDSPLKMMAFQYQIEKRFFDAGDGSQKAPAQRMTDFIAARDSKSLPSTAYTAGIYPARVDRLLPKEISSRLRKGFEEFGRKQRGFATEAATVIGCETRTSAPVRIPRDNETLQHVSMPGLFPAGEGAGYAGGIVSAAIDGDRVAAAVCDLL